MAITQECGEQYWTSPGGNTQQNANYTVTYLPSRKLVRRTRHAGHCWRSRDELISGVLLWTPTYGWAKAGWPARTYIHQLCEDTGYSPEDQLEAINDREKWRERVRDIGAGGTTWWWWLIHMFSLPSLDPEEKVNKYLIWIYPIPLQKGRVTKGQFLLEFIRFESKFFLLLDWLP